MSKRKLALMENSKCFQYEEQKFPVVEEPICDKKWLKVKVISYAGKTSYLCHYFRVEVVKDHDGLITYIVLGKGKPEKKSEDDFDRDVSIMRTDDFNRAYDLKNKLDSLLGDFFTPNEKQKMHCYGSLQREKLMWE